ncbi:MAG: FG-GAP repeat domain-containing protein [Planctomycetaceae bacterium]
MRAVCLRWGVLVSMVVAAAVCAFTLPAQEEEMVNELSQFYGFKPLELVKLSDRSANLVAGDLNKDGLSDLAIADNGHSRIDLLLQRAAKPANGPTAKPEVNQFASHWRFEHRKLSVDHEIAAMALGDFNHDGRTDIAYFGGTDKLVIRYQPQTGEWAEKTTIRLPDVPAFAWVVLAGDLNNDSRDDIAVLGMHQTYLLYQQKDGKFAAPESLFNTSQRLTLGQIADLDGDGRKDLCYLSNDEGEQALAARLQGQDGKLGPELRFEMTKPRSVSIAQMDRTPQVEVLTVDSITGRIKVLQMERPAPKPGELSSRLIQYGLGQQGAGKDRDLALADLDGDGLTDVVVSDAEAARMIVFKQRKGIGLEQGEAFPGLVGADQVRAADLDGKEGAEVVVLSTKEKTIGVSRMAEGRLTFPQALPLAGKEPIALELADLDNDKQPEVIYLTKARAARETTYTLEALRRAANGTWEPHQFDGKPSVTLELKASPNRIQRLDLNNDGKPEFMIFGGSDKAPSLFSLDEKGVPKELKTDGGIQLGNVQAGAMFFGQLQNPALLVAQDKFVRNMRFDEAMRGWQVADQFNAAEATAKTVGAATINLDGKPGNEIVLIDVGVQKLKVLRLEEGLYRPWQEVELGRFPFKSPHVADLNGDGQDDLLLFGQGKFAVLYSGRADPTMKELASYETKSEKAFFADVVGGDLNGDAQPDLAAIDTRSHNLEILNFKPATTDQAASLRAALAFQVFEEKSFQREEEGGDFEPRESLIVDVTNDGRPDLVLLVHDRILIYPQDDARSEVATTPAATR